METDSYLNLLNCTQVEVDLDLQLADVRYGFIHTQCRQLLQQHGKLGIKGSERLDNLLLHRWLGIPIFLGVMYLMFLFAIKVGSAFVDFFDILAGTLFVDGLRVLLSSLQLPEWLISTLADGFGSGIQTVATFIPIIGS